MGCCFPRDFILEFRKSPSYNQNRDFSIWNEQWKVWKLNALQFLKPKNLALKQKIYTSWATLIILQLKLRKVEWYANRLHKFIGILYINAIFGGIIQEGCLNRKEAGVFTVVNRINTVNKYCEPK